MGLRERGPVTEIAAQFVTMRNGSNGVMVRPSSMVSTVHGCVHWSSCVRMAASSVLLIRHDLCPAQVRVEHKEDPPPERNQRRHTRGSAPRSGLHVKGSGMYICAITADTQSAGSDSIFAWPCLPSGSVRYTLRMQNARRSFPSNAKLNAIVPG